MLRRALARAGRASWRSSRDAANASGIGAALGCRALSQDVETARRSAQAAAAKLKAEDAPRGDSGPINVFDRALKTQQVRARWLRARVRTP